SARRERRASSFRQGQDGKKEFGIMNDRIIHSPRTEARAPLSSAFSVVLSAALSLLPSAAAFGQSSWTSRHPATPPVSLQAVSWTGSQLVAVGDGGAIALSSNGALWTRRDSAPGP